jgi:NAD(P)-dependent dehydrogenase (short-subunit alcohol dehydrogenase family)
MTSGATPVSPQRDPELLGQTVVVIGGSAGIGLETARRARAEGAEVILTGRNPERLNQAAREVDAQRAAAFDANDATSLERFFEDLPTPIDHVMITAGGPHYGPLLEMDSAQVRQAMSGHAVLALEVARNAAGKMRPGRTLLLMGGTGGRRVGRGLGIVSAATAALPPFTAALALELAPVRVNLIAAGFVDTPLSASLLGDRLEERRNELRSTLPIGRVVGPADVAALAVHIMSTRHSPARRTTSTAGSSSSPDEHTLNAGRESEHADSSRDCDRRRTLNPLRRERDWLPAGHAAQPVRRPNRFVGDMPALSNACTPHHSRPRRGGRDDVGAGERADRHPFRLC